MYRNAAAARLDIQSFHQVPVPLRPLMRASTMARMSLTRLCARLWIFRHTSSMDSGIAHYGLTAFSPTPRLPCRPSRSLSSENRLSQCVSVHAQSSCVLLSRLTHNSHVRIRRRTFDNSPNSSLHSAGMWATVPLCLACAVHESSAASLA
jgi:hypothetical protein